MLIIAGSCSALGPEYQKRYHVPLFQQAEVVTIENAGHRNFVDQFPYVLEAIKAYLLAYQPAAGG